MLVRGIFYGDAVHQEKSEHTLGVLKVFVSNNALK